LDGKTSCGVRFALWQIFRVIDARLATASGASLWPFNHEILEKKPTLAAVQWTAATYARYLAVNGRSLRGFNPNDFVFCRAVRAIEGCRVRIRHKRRIVYPSRETEAPNKVGALVHSFVDG
jgi:hypothetical protein